jgi:uncharacterized membrane protein HdeD (DUF308 family)
MERGEPAFNGWLERRLKMRHLMASFWWILVVRGLLGILFGLEALWLMGALEWRDENLYGLDILIRPQEVLATLVLLLGLYAFLDGIFAIVLGAQNYGKGRRWWTLIGEGVFSTGLGFLAWFRPGVSILVLLYWLGSWSLLSGLLEMGQGLRGCEYRDRRKTFFYAGFCSVIFGLLVLWRGFEGAELAWIIGLYLLISGVPLLVLGLHLRRFTLKSV